VAGGVHSNPPPMTSRKRFLGYALTPLAAGLPAAVGAQPTGPLVRVACNAVAAYAEALYGTDMGFFKKAGLNTELILLGTGAEITNAVAGGSAEVGISNAIPIANAFIHGLHFSYLCSGGMGVLGTIELCVASESPITGAKDLAGKTIGASSLKDITAAAVMAWLDQNGGDSSSVHIIELPFSEMAVAVKRGTVAAAAIPEPLLRGALREGGVRSLHPDLFDVFGKNFMIGGWFAKPDWIKQNPVLVRQFVEAIYASGAWANAHSDDAAAIISKYSKQDVAVIRAMTRPPYGSALTPAMIQATLDVAAKYKVLERPVNAADLIASR
jgi:NitT/TauT family transport system substrate-binding protein